jgi:hypothetical protein
MSTKRDLILEKYLKVCKDSVSDDQVFDTFKSNPDYCEVLEHLNKKLGQVHLDAIKKYNPDILLNPNIWLNDVYGSPRMEHYGDCAASPTTIQYISVASNLKYRFNSLDDFSIVEIGGGYGGQAKIIYDLWNIKKYHSIDLYEATLLQEKYISKFKYNNFAAFPYNDFVFDDYDLFISNYAVSEVSPEDQYWYVTEVMLRCKRGYITCNQPLNGMELLKEKFGHTFVITKDIVGEREDNYVITWGDTL